MGIPSTAVCSVGIYQRFRTADKSGKTSKIRVISPATPQQRRISPTLALDGFGDLSDDEREVLFETFRVWLDNDASVRTTADILFLHPNTVRKRLHRIERRTGRSVSRPRDVIELALALEVHSRLM